MQEITPISFLKFCGILSDSTTIGYARVLYTEFSSLMKNESFRAFLQSGEFSTEVDFCFKAQKQFGTSVSVSKIIYKHHVKK